MIRPHDSPNDPLTEIARLQQRYYEIDWGERPDTAVLIEVDFNRHWTQTHILNVDDPKQKPRLLWDMSMDEHYKDPGTPVMRKLANGASVIRMEGDSMFTSGDGSSPEGDRPFLDRLHLDTLRTERIFRSNKGSLEYFVSFTGPGSSKIITRHQSHQDPPNLFARTIGKSVNLMAGEAAFSNTVVPITHLTDPTPAVRQIQKRLVKYKRADGLDLSFTLYTPPGYQEGQRLPTILYA